MELKLSKQMKIVAAAGGVLIVGLVAFMLLGRSQGGAKPVFTAAPQAPPAPKAAAHKGKAVVQLNAGLPGALRKALLAHDVVIAVVYGAGDSDAIAAAQQGAKTAHAGFAALDVGQESIARDVAQLVPGIGDPAVLVVRRPGTVTASYPGYSDADTIAQAAAAPPPTVTTDVPPGTDTTDTTDTTDMPPVAAPTTDTTP